MGWTSRGALSKVALPLVMIAAVTPAMAQAGASAPTPAAAPSADNPPLKGPSFQSGGIKVTPVSVVGKASKITMSLAVENRSPDDLLIAIIGPPTGIDNGSTFQAEQITGVTYCDGGGNTERAYQIASCLKGDPSGKARIPLDSFTPVEHGNAILMNMTMSSRDNATPDSKVMSLVLTVAVVKDTSADAGALNVTSHPKTGDNGLPAGIRFVSLGLPAVPLSQ